MMGEAGGVVGGWNRGREGQERGGLNGGGDGRHQCCQYSNSLPRPDLVAQVNMDQWQLRSCYQSRPTHAMEALGKGMIVQWTHVTENYQVWN